MEHRLIMDRFFYNNYYKYFLWNNGLLEHFFKNGKGEILLHIDRHLLEEIGKTKGIETDDYKEDFISCVEHFCAHYNRYVCVKRDPNGDNVCGYSDCKYYSSIFCLKNKRRSDVLAVANHIYSKDIKYFDRYEAIDGSIKIRVSEEKKALMHAMPFFAIVIYVILKFDNGETQEWANVGDTISASSRTFIPELWELINQYNNRFDKDASVYDRSNSEYGDYAGRILYHLPLSASTRNKIQDAIYKSSVWKLIDSKTFLEIIGIIMNSLKKDVKANEELRDILLKCYSANDYKGISARKVQSVIDDFDIDVYESKIAERKQSADYSQTIVSGEFALGVFFPNDDEGTENSIVLLTTVQQSVNEKGYEIKEGKSGTLAGYNTSFVKIDKQANIELKDYVLKTNKYSILPLRTDDVIFFYEYDDSLFIQTREIKPSKSYIIAVRKGIEPDFEKWCAGNNNTMTRWPNEDTRELFGNDWTIYYTENRLNGQYYKKDETKASELQESSAIVMKGGIKKSNGAYFINALPYFEIPAKIIPEQIKVFLNLNGVYDENKYIYGVVDNKIIIDIKEMPIDSSEVAYVDICLEHNGNDYCYSINVCGQSIFYNPLYTYKYNKFGVLTNDKNDCSFYGNHIDKKYQTEKIQGIFQINKEDFSHISDDLYFTNLLAACCYNSEYSEITHAKFRKCVSYAATRLNIDIQKEGFISNTKRLFGKAGIVHFDYSTSKCQAIPPSFMRVPFSVHQTTGSQLLMLGGCYTRSFIADLIDFCNDHNVSIFSINGKRHSDEEKLLPPIILVGHNFSPSEFSNEYNQQCDILDDNDFALSLLNMVPTYNEICSQFHFEHNDSHEFLPRLEPSSEPLLPRIRSMRSTSTQRVRYIEKANNVFAEIKNGMTAWASMYCHHEMSTPMVIMQRDYSVYLPTTLLLPNYIERALYLMNLGLPETRKVFVCGDSGDTYYSLLNQYKLHNETRCNVLANKLTGSENYATNNLARKGVQTKHKMEFYISALNGGKYREMYMILRDHSSTDILAVAHRHRVYLNCQGTFFRVDAKNVNEVMTFLIQDRWVFGNERKSIGYSKGGGLSFESVFRLTDETLKLPNLTNFNNEPIQIL